MTKILLTISSAVLGVWMGVGFFASADPADRDHGMVPPGHGDSHRLGVAESTGVVLPSWEASRSGEWSPILSAVAAAD